MKIAFVALCLVGVAFAEVKFSLLADEEYLKGVIDASMKHVESRLSKASMDRQGPPFGPCDHNVWVAANRNFLDKLEVPTVAFGYKVIQAVRSLQIADGIEGHRALSQYTLEFFVELIGEDLEGGGNIGCFHPINLRALGFPYEAILPIILGTTSAGAAAITVELLATDYSCAVKATIFRFSDELRLLTQLFTAALSSGENPCVPVRGFVSALRQLFTFACNEEIGLYAYINAAAPLSVLFPQCNLDPGAAAKIAKQMTF